MTKHPGGRPTEYGPTVLVKARAYLAQCQDEEVQVVKQSGENKSGGYEMFDNRLKVKLPSIEGLAIYLKVHRSTLYEWERLHPKFSDILEEIKAEQAHRLMNNGLSGSYNSTIAKLILTKHGYSDKQETDITSGGKPLPILANMNVPPHDGDNQDSGAQEAHQGGAGRDVGVKDRVHPPAADPPGAG